MSKIPSTDSDRETISYQPIGYLRSIFASKNGTPRQSGLSEYARASLTVSKELFSNPCHSLHSLDQFSHVWLLWSFHHNVGPAVKAKVAPPRLGGERVGVFSTRSPHRPNSIGLTLARLEAVQDDTLHLTGVDMVEGTPVLDIKPYIPQYDRPPASPGPQGSEAVPNSSTSTSPTSSSSSEQIPSSVRCPPWLGDESADLLQVIFSSRAEEDLLKLDMSRCQWLKSPREVRAAIKDILCSDPRSVYRKTKCSDRMYFTQLDGLHVSAWFDPDIDGMEVVKIKHEVNSSVPM